MWRYQPMKTCYLMSEFQKLDAWKGRLFFVHSFHKTCGGESPLAGRNARAAPLPPLWLLLYNHYIENNNENSSEKDILFGIFLSFYIFTKAILYILLLRIFIDWCCCLKYFVIFVVAWNISWLLFWLRIFIDFCCDLKYLLIFVLA